MLEFKQIILGNATFAEFAASMFFAMLTAIALILFRVKKRDPLSPRTPENFSWQFFWNDNFRQQLGTFILIFLSIRISQFWMEPAYIVYVAVGIGLVSDQLAMLALKAKDAATKFLANRITRVENKVDGMKESTDVKLDDIKDQVDEIKKEN